MDRWDHEQSEDLVGRVVKFGSQSYVAELLKSHNTDPMFACVM